MKVLGLMSGTSMDGLDCCYADIDINSQYDFNYDIIDCKTIPFNENTRNLIIRTITNQQEDIILTCHKKLGMIFLNIVKDFYDNIDFELIAMHGQTISHINKHKSIQIGDPHYLFDYYNIPIIYDFRSRDIQLGGNGAPLVPYLDWLLSKNTDIDIITVNLGGIANITYIPKESTRDNVIGFDTGPGMCLIDQFMQIKWNLSFDSNGDIAKTGKIDQCLLYALLKHPFINKQFPKSTSREEFGFKYLNNIIKKYPSINKYDMLRTLVFFTSKSIYRNIKFVIDQKKEFMLLLSGGGVNNNLLVSDIKNIFNNKKIYTSEYYGIHIDAKEAFLMAVMGLSRYKNINNNMPSVTGAKKYASYGKIYK